MTIPLTGTQYDIEAGDYRATVTELGAGLRELKFTGTPLVTSYASQRTTPLAASLLHCAARGQAAAEVAAVLHGVAGEDPVEPAVRRLLTAKTAAVSTADLTWGLATGCRAAQALSVS